MSTAFILGAGFSSLSGLPIQSEFSALLLAGEFSSDLDKVITKALGTFLADVFGWRPGQTIPALEDVFTCIDLAANAGHLGIKYTPKKLRALRRMAIYRIFSVLDRKFSHSPVISALLDQSLEGADIRGFIVLNWDIVLEKHLTQRSSTAQIDYCCDAMDWNRVGHTDGPCSPGIAVCKMHGSSNWAYCQNCTGLYFDLNEKLSLHRKVGLIKADFRLFDEGLTDRAFDEALGISSKERACPRCKHMVSSHIATFSYRKSFQTHAYASIWHRAGDILGDSTHWVFIGYSLPKADFELKSLMKTAQLRYRHLSTQPPRRIDVVAKSDMAREDYERFFGRDQFSFFNGGLEQYVRTHALVRA
jgi:hypothetical protein